MNKFRKLGFIHYNGGGIHIWDSEDEQKIWMREARLECEKLVETYWPTIKKIAAVLEKNGRMWGDDVRKIISEK